jgi:predicted RNA-binding protein YlxR (DUF448 family)
MAQNTVKRIPERRCLACGTHRPKSELLRVLRLPSGEVCVDTSGKMSGRGAYLCKSAECLKRARKGRRIEYALECPIPDTVYLSVEEAIVNG